MSGPLALRSFNLLSSFVLVLNYQLNYSFGVLDHKNLLLKQKKL